MPGLIERVGARLGFVPAARVGQEVDRVVRDYALGWPSPALFGMFGGSAGSTGQPVTPLSALQAAGVWACVKRVSEDIAKLPVAVKRRRADGGWEEDPNHEFNNILRRPNDWMTPFEFWRYMVMNLELRGNAIAVIKRGWDGAPIGIIPLNWDRVSVLLSPNGLLFYNVSHPMVGWGVTFHQDDIIHIRGLTVDGGYLGLTPIAAAQDVVGLSVAMQKHGAVLFRQGAQVSAVLKHPAKLSKEVAERLRESWQGVYGGVENAHKTAILEEGMSLEKLTMTNQDSQYLEARMFQVIEICRIFGVPPHKVYDLTKANFASLENQEQAYISDSLYPRVVNIEQAFDGKVFWEDDAGRVKLGFNFKGLLRGDLKSRSDAYGSALNNGWMSVNEVRASEDMPPIEGGDTYRVPVNTAPIGSAQAQGDSTGGGQAPKPLTDAGPGTGGPLAPVETETADQGVG